MVSESMNMAPALAAILALKEASGLNARIETARAVRQAPHGAYWRFTLFVRQAFA
jgi:hypothetical protein